MNDDRAKKDEERLGSFLNLLLGIDSGAMLFFLIVRGDKLGEGRLPFHLAFLPFKPQVLMLAFCALYVLLLRGSNLFWHDKAWFRQFSKWSAMALLFVSIIAFVWGGWTLSQNLDFLPAGKK